MAKTLVFFTFFVFFSALTIVEPSAFSRSLLPSEHGLKKETLTHLHFYFRDTFGGQNLTAIEVAQAPTTSTSKTFFGGITVMDDPLTVGPEKTSKLIGKARGMYASASFTEFSLLMVMNLEFIEEKFNGSSLSILGMNPVFATLREMPIVGGSGVFRFARGYAQVRPYFFNHTLGYAIVEYDVYVFHY